MPLYQLKCKTCSETHEFTMPMARLRENLRMKCPTCKKSTVFNKDWGAGIARYQSRHSPGHPRFGRGMTRIDPPKRKGTAKK